MDKYDKYKSDLKEWKECNEKLRKFGKRLFTYINQIFGDEEVRALITEIYPKPSYRLGIRPFTGSQHHVVEITERVGKKIEVIDTLCSLKQGHQDVDTDIYDMLCQSYSLLNYFNKEPISNDKIQKQMQMIKMYRKILSNKKFLPKFEVILNQPERFNDYVYGNEDGNEPGTTNPLYLHPEYHNNEITINKKSIKQNILSRIKEVLNEWEEYGYQYYIGQGECPNKPPPIFSPRKTRTRVTRATRAMGGKKIRRRIYSRKRNIK